MTTPTRPSTPTPFMQCLTPEARAIIEKDTRQEELTLVERRFLRMGASMEEIRKAQAWLKQQEFMNKEIFVKEARRRQFPHVFK
jgi:hypothetical protein